MNPHVFLPALVLTLLCAGSTNVRAATISVTNAADSGAGSLRAALASATNGDTIDATGVFGAIILTSGELLITNNLNINGSGPANLAVNGNFPNTTNRVFNINNSTVSISGLTITNGHSGDNSGGGGIIIVASTMTVSNCAVSGNSAPAGGGGGISVPPSSHSTTLTIVNSILSGNSAGNGGGIYALGFHSDPVALTVVGSTISSNSATARGGGLEIDITQAVGTLIVVNSTLNGNSASVGGGIASFGNIPDVKVALTNATLSGNTSTSQGGGVWIYSASGGGVTMALISSTLSGNSAPTGGGIYGIVGFRIGNTILNAGSSGSNISGGPYVTSWGYNLSSDDGGGLLTDPTDQININPMLGPLQDNGGPAATHALLNGSPAIDKGKNLGSVTTDERGFPRTYDDPAIANAAGGDGTDIGAYEAYELRITAIDKVGDDLQFSFTSLPGMNYELQTRSDLGSGMWSSAPGSFPGNGSIAQATATNAFGQPQQFYRIHQLP